MSQLAKEILEALYKHFCDSTSFSQENIDFLVTDIEAEEVVDEILGNNIVNFGGAKNVGN